MKFRPRTDLGCGEQSARNFQSNRSRTASGGVRSKVNASGGVGDLRNPGRASIIQRQNAETPKDQVTGKSLCSAVGHLMPPTEEGRAVVWMSFAEPIWASGHGLASKGRTHDCIRT